LCSPRTGAQEAKDVGAGFKMMMSGEPGPFIVGAVLVAAIAFFIYTALRNDINDDKD
jgi:hypothetical protein